MSAEEAISMKKMRHVLDVSRMLAITTDLDPLLRRIAEATTNLLNCERASIFLHDAKTRQLWTKVALQSKEIRVPETAGIVGAAFAANQVLDIPEPYKDPRFNQEFDRRTGFVTRDILAAPMVDTDGKPLGVIQAINKRDGKFAPEDRPLIQLLADQAGVAIQRYRLQLAAMESVALRREMDLARKVQEAIIPRNAPEIPGIEAAGFARPASITGGDVYDLWRTRDGRMGIFLGDASGHGMAPTLVVCQVRTLVRTLAEMLSDPLEIMTRINARMAGDLEAGRFITAFIGFLSCDGLLSYCSAGHGPILYRASRSSPLREIDPAVPPIGVLEELPDEAAAPIQLEAGGALLVMSDGIFEARGPADEQFGVDRVRQLLENNLELPAARVIESIYNPVHAWENRDEPADDQTIVLARPAGVG
ncbi:MAG TPA: GAF domain-containing SpoIIE family protein phosphatase [Tepidisphaeraceae bacterium]|nr:GAF domain-containing SpoIIE family protein phosphatase [Tepidisphaeraceae bacterium]